MLKSCWVEHTNKMVKFIAIWTAGVYPLPQHFTSTFSTSWWWWCWWCWWWWCRFAQCLQNSCFSMPNAWFMKRLSEEGIENFIEQNHWTDNKNKCHLRTAEKGEGVHCLSWDIIEFLKRWPRVFRISLDWALRLRSNYLSIWNCLQKALRQLRCLF